MVAHVSEDGEIIRVLDDSEGKVINFITSVTEFDGNLFFGSIATNFVGKLSLAKVPQLQEAASSIMQKKKKNKDQGHQAISSC